VKLTTHLHLVPRSKNAWRYAFTSQYAFMARCSVRKKDRGNFTFTFTFAFTFTYPDLVSHFEGGTQTEGFWEQSVEEDIWTCKGGR
jgi:hypothetical protein